MTEHRQTDAAETPQQIASRLTSEGLIPISHAARMLVSERGDGKVAPMTLWRWAKKGKKGRRLEVCRGSGAGLFTSKEALARFLAMPMDPPIRIGTNRRAHNAAMKALKKVGIVR